MRSVSIGVIAVLMLAACTTEPASPAAPANRSAEIIVSTIPKAPAQPRQDPGADATLDLDGIIERGQIRVLVARSGTHFLTNDGAHSGRTVDAAVALAQVLSGRARKPIRPVFIETHEPDLIPHLLAGKGDVAANVLLTFERDEQVAFAAPIRTGIRELVVTHERQPVVSLEDVGMRTIYVRQGSDHHKSLERLNEQLRKIDRPPARVELVLPPVTDEQLIERVSNGQIAATIADDYIFKSAAARFPNAVANPDIAVSQDGSLSWVTRKDAPKLIALLNDFFKTHKLTF